MSKEGRVDIMIYTLAKAERMILEEMYPAGSRVQLDYMEADPYSKLEPGDMGTVRMLDDAGGLHISWDRGGSLALLYKVDRCSCLMKKEQMDAFFNHLFIMPFESCEKMKAWIEKKLRPVFPAMTFENDTKDRLEVNLNVDAFEMKSPQIGIEYQIDENGHLFIKKSGWRQDDPTKDKINKTEKPKR